MMLRDELGGPLPIAVLTQPVAGSQATPQRLMEP
jgi:hypothetical protein